MRNGRLQHSPSAWQWNFRLHDILYILLVLPISVLCKMWQLMIEMLAHLNSEVRSWPCLMHSGIYQLLFKSLQRREPKPALSDMSESSSVWSLQFPTAGAYLPHLNEKPWVGEDWGALPFCYICIQCLQERSSPPSSRTSGTTTKQRGRMEPFIHSEMGQGWR